MPDAFFTPPIPEYFWYQTGFEPEAPMPPDELTRKVVRQLQKLKARHDCSQAKERRRLARDYHRFWNKGATELTKAMCSRHERDMSNLFPDYDLISMIDYSYDCAAGSRLADAFMDWYSGLHGLSAKPFAATGLLAGIFFSCAEHPNIYSSIIALGKAGLIGLSIGFVGVPLLAGSAMSANALLRGSRRKLQEAADSYIQQVDGFISTYGRARASNDAAL